MVAGSVKENSLADPVLFYHKDRDDFFPDKNKFYINPHFAVPVHNKPYGAKFHYRYTLRLPKDANTVDDGIYV
jgi:hypothetical protein